MSIRAWARRNVYYLSMTMGICCVLEFVFQFIGGTDYHLDVTPQTYKVLLVVFGGLFFTAAAVARPRSSGELP